MMARPLPSTSAGKHFSRNIRSNPAIRFKMGRLAQLVEHLLYTQGVGGSSPSPPMDAWFSCSTMLDPRLGSVPVYNTPCRGGISRVGTRVGCPRVAGRLVRVLPQRASVGIVKEHPYDVTAIIRARPCVQPATKWRNQLGHPAARSTRPGSSSLRGIGDSEPNGERTDPLTPPAPCRGTLRPCYGIIVMPY